MNVTEYSAPSSLVNISIRNVPVNVQSKFFFVSPTEICHVIYADQKSACLATVQIIELNWIFYSWINRAFDIGKGKAIWEVQRPITAYPIYMSSEVASGSLPKVFHIENECVFPYTTWNYFRFFVSVRNQMGRIDQQLFDAHISSQLRALSGFHRADSFTDTARLADSDPNEDEGKGGQHPVRVANPPLQRFPIWLLISGLAIGGGLGLAGSTRRIRNHPILNFFLLDVFPFILATGGVLAAFINWDVAIMWVAKSLTDGG